MHETATTAETTATDEVRSEAAAPAGDALVEDALVEDVLVEEVSIDGMCGVY